MKKAKMFLVGIAVCGIVGGAVAVKAAKFGGTIYYTTALPNVAANNTITGVTTATGTSVYYTFVHGAVPPTANFKPIKAQL